MSEEVSGTPADKPQKKVATKLVIVDANETTTPTTAKKIEIKDEESPAEVQQLTETPEVTGVEAPVDVAVDEEITEQEVQDKAADTTEATPGEELIPQEGMTVGDAIDATAEPSEDLAEQDEVLKIEEDGGPEVAISDTESPAPEAEEPVTESTEEPQEKEDFADEKTVVAVDDIAAKDADELLKRQDAEKDQLEVVQKKQSRLKSVFANWWKNPATKWGTIVGFFLVILLIVLLPTTRYSVLNAMGVRAKSSVIVVSDESQQPLKNVDVTIGGQKVLTDENGTASFTKLKLGKTSIKISKRGYSVVERTKVLGWGSNPLGQVGLKVTGTKFSFVVRDFLSDKAVLGAEAISGDFNASSDKDGNIELAIDPTNDKDFEVTIKASDYRDQKVTIKIIDQTEKIIKLVPNKRHVFVSKRSGKFDVYKIDADGKNESLLLAATGSERDDMIVLPHPTSDFAAIVSSREGKRNKDGYLLSGLFVVNVATGELAKVTQSERIQLIDWTGDRIVYIAVTEGASAANASRSKLLSFEIGQPGPKEIASANYFNDATVFKGAVYYAPSSYAIPAASVKFYKVNPDGSNLSVLFDKEVWNIFRFDYDTLYLSVQQDWYELRATGSPTKLSSSPASLKSRLYKESPDKKRALWVDSRDGKGVLLAYNTEIKKDETIETRAGLNQPVYWLSSTTLVFRVSDGREVADYVKNIEGGEAKKLRDVTNTDTSYYFN